MKPRTFFGVLALLGVLIAAGAFGAGQQLGSGGTLTERWVSDTARDALGNHHAPTAKSIGNETMIVIPVNANADQQTDGCVLYAYLVDAGEYWQSSVPSEECNIHAFGDPTIADLDGDGDEEVFVATTEEVIRAYDATTGEELFRRWLSGWGYAAPRITDFAPARGRELIVADLSGGVFVFDSTGSLLWSQNFSTIVAPIFVDDFNADGTDELAIGEGNNVTLLEHDGTIAWQTRVGEAVTWLTTGQADTDESIELIAATATGRVVAVNGRSGSIEWEQEFNTLAAVHAFGDGDRDGQAEVYAVAQDGVLRAIDASDGTVEWSTTLTTEDVQMTPPPALGDLDGDGDLELVAVSQDGVVSIVNPRSGAIVDSAKREVPIWMRPTLVDLDDDGTLEIMVIYGDGRVTAFSYRTE